MAIFFSDIFPWGRETKEKNKQMELHQTKKVLHSKGNKTNEKTTNWTGEHICQLYIWWGVNIQNLEEFM